MSKKITDTVNQYYTQKLDTYGVSPKGVDWKDEQSQQIRLQQLLRIIRKESFSINDLGCGYGALLDVLSGTKENLNYIGYDLSAKMIEEAKLKYPDSDFRCIDQSTEMVLADYTIASGIFNVKLEFNNEEWLKYVLQTIETMVSKSKAGCAFNILTKYSDREYMRDYLYYADPCYIFNFCKEHFSRNVALLHDYDLYEFTILIKLD
jgi:SAM-dependent methyltransferase